MQRHRRCSEQRPDHRAAPPHENAVEVTWDSEQGQSGAMALTHQPELQVLQLRLFCHVNDIQTILGITGSTNQTMLPTTPDHRNQ